MVETRRSAAAKRPAAGEEQEDKGAPASPAPAPTEDPAAGPGAADDVASSQPPKRAKVRISLHPPCMWPLQVFGFDLVFVVMVVGWVRGGGYREAIGGAGRCGSAQHGWAAGADRRHGQAGGPLEVQGGSVQSGRYEPCPYDVPKAFFRFSLGP
jgi:hypothetical protein